MGEYFSLLTFPRDVQQLLWLPVNNQFNDVGFQDSDWLRLFIAAENEEEDDRDDGEYQHQDAHEKTARGMGAVDGAVATSFAFGERRIVRIAAVAVVVVFDFVDVLPNDIEDAWWNYRNKLGL